MKKIKIDNKQKLWIIICGILIIAILGVLISTLVDKHNSDKETADLVAIASQDPGPEPQYIYQTEYVDKIVEVEVEKEVTQEMLQEGLNDMGVLITEDYYFTQVESFTKTQTILKYITTESNFIYSYDGVVTAGIDFSEVSVSKDDENKVITITVPASDIQLIDIDYDSFKVYEEKEGMWNPLTLEDYNDSMVEFESNAKQKAIDKGVLTRADENAQNIIQNFVSGMVDMSEYKIEYIKSKEVTK